MKDKPKECVNSKCPNTFYVPKNELHLPLVCEQCQKRNKPDEFDMYNEDKAWQDLSTHNERFTD